MYEVDSTTGALKRTIERSVFNNAVQLGGGPSAGTVRTNDFESIAYDRTDDVLYLFSGPCCNSSILPTAFRLTRQSGQFQVESYQPLPAGADYTGAAWSPTDGKIYVAKGQQIRSFDYASGTEGTPFAVAGVKEITGMDFSSDGTDLFVTVGSERRRIPRPPRVGIVVARTSENVPLSFVPRSRNPGREPTPRPANTRQPRPI